MVAEKKAGIGGGERERVPEVARPTPEPDADDPRDAGRARAGRHRLDLARVVEIEVGVRVDERHGARPYFTRVPGAIPSPTVTTWRFGGSPAARSIPCEVMPRSGRGARFATTTMRLPTSACGSG